MCTRIYRNWKYLCKQAGLLTAGLYSILGFVRMFSPLDGFINPSFPFLRRVIISVAILAGVWATCFLISSICLLCKKRIKVIDGNNNNSVYVIYGDIFSNKILSKKIKRRNICFAVNRCFDTVVDDKLISSHSIHGVAFNMLYAQGKYNPQSLNKAIQSSIPPSAQYEVLKKSDKPAGNLKRYEVGTAADITVSDGLHFFLLGATTFDSTLTSHIKRDEYCLAIQRMIEFCDQQAQGFPVLLPLIGGALARTGQKEKDLLEYMLQSFKLNIDHINSDFFIVIRNSAKDILSTLNH